MATYRAGSRLMQFQKSGIQHTLRSVVRSPIEANIESQTRLKKMVACGNSISISQSQSSHGLGIGCGAAVLEAIEFDNKLLNWSFGRVDDVLLAQGKKPVSEDDDDDSDIDDDGDDIEGLLEDDDDFDDIDEDDLDDEDIVEVKKGSRG